jgi:hypothetical protein
MNLCVCQVTQVGVFQEMDRSEFALGRCVLFTSDCKSVLDQEVDSSGIHCD